MMIKNKNYNKQHYDLITVHLKKDESKRLKLHLAKVKLSRRKFILQILDKEENK